MRQLKIITTLCLLTLSSFVFAKDVRVVSSIYPYQQIANAILTKPSELIVDSFISPHHYQVKPSDAKTIRDAEIFVWGGEVMTPQLARIVESRADDKVTIDASKLAGIYLIQLSEDDAHDHAEDEHNDDEHSHGGHDYDPHLWLSPDNAIVIATAIKDKMVMLDAENASIYEQNLQTFTQQLQQTSATIKTQLATTQGKKYFVFHNAYRYFEQAFGLKSAGVIKTDPSKLERSKALLELKQEMSKETGCLFIEPQFQQKLVEQLASDNIRIGVLDPIGYKGGKSTNLKDQTPLSQGYNEILLNLATSFVQCFTAT